MRISGTLLMFAAAAALLVGCGGGRSGETQVAKANEHRNAAKKSPVRAKKPPQKKVLVTVTVEGREGPTDAGLLVAEQRGYFSDVGIEAWIGAPTIPSRPVGYVVDGTDEIGVASQAQVAIAKAEGAPIVAIGSLVSQPTAALIWLKMSKIGTIADLKGKVIAIPGVPFQEALLEKVLEQNGLTLDDVKVKRVAYKLVPALLNGRADAIFGGSWNLEGVDLELLGANPVIKRVPNLGIPVYEEAVLIARTDLVDKQPRLIRKFISAVARGTEAALKDPAAAAVAIPEAGESNLELSPKISAAEVRATLPLLSRSGRMDPRRTTNFVHWLHREGLIQHEPRVSGLLTNHFLASP